MIDQIQGQERLLTPVAALSKIEYKPSITGTEVGLLQFDLILVAIGVPDHRLDLFGHIAREFERGGLVWNSSLGR